MAIGPDGGDGGQLERDVRSCRIFLATVRNERIGTRKITVRNLSRRGLGARCEVPLEVGERVLVDLGDAGELEGVVRWATGDRFGLLLGQAIAPDSFNFSGKDWSVAQPRVEPGHVPEHVRPVARAWRPGFKTR